jgi:SAM-dependent methyltransferase
MRVEASSDLVNDGPTAALHSPSAPEQGRAAAIAPFDRAAETYDNDFTNTQLGRALRQRVWQRLGARFAPGARVLELNCGTGEDAAWLASRNVQVLATDQSEAMLAVTRRKTAGLPVQTARLDLNQLPVTDYHLNPFDGAFSDFGGLNCVADLRPLADALARWLAPGSALVLVVMGPACLWEVAWHLAHGKPGTALRRWRRGGSTARLGGQSFRVFYPGPAAVARAFAFAFRPVRLEGLGVALPPSLLAGAMERHARLFRLLGALEDRIKRLWPFPYLGDHYILELERRG